MREGRETGGRHLGKEQGLNFNCVLTHFFPQFFIRKGLLNKESSKKEASRHMFFLVSEWEEKQGVRKGGRQGGDGRKRDGC